MAIKKGLGTAGGWFGFGIVLDMKDAIIEFLTTDNQLHKISVENPFTKVKKTKFALDSDSNRISYSDEVFYEDITCAMSVFQQIFGNGDEFPFIANGL